MSSSGISATNSGPLAIRTYNSGSNKTFILTDYDVPVPSNFALITSTNGQLVPSNNIYVSSIGASTIYSSTATINNATINTATINYISSNDAIIYSITSNTAIITNLSSNITHLSSIYLPVPSNYVLITTTGGLVAPSNNIYVSSINTSSILADNAKLDISYLSTVYSVDSAITFNNQVNIEADNLALFVNGSTVFTEPGALTNPTNSNVTIWGANSGLPISESFTTTTTYTINSTISKINFQLIGAGGASTLANSGINQDIPGYGAYLSGTLTVKQGDSLRFTIGTIDNNGSKGTSLVYISTTGIGTYVSTLVAVLGAGGGNGYASGISSSSGGGHGGGGQGLITMTNMDYIGLGTNGYDGISTINGVFISDTDGGQGGQSALGGSGGNGNPASPGTNGNTGGSANLVNLLVTGGLTVGGEGGTVNSIHGGWGGGGYTGGGGGGASARTSAGGGGGATYIATSTLSGFLSNVVCLGGQFLANNNASPFGDEYGLPNNSGFALISGYSPNDTLYTNGDIQCRVLRYDMLDPPINAIGGAAALWALYPAIDTINMNDNAIIECGGLEVASGGIDITGNSIFRNVLTASTTIIDGNLTVNESTIMNRGLSLNTNDVEYGALKIQNGSQENAIFIRDGITAGSLGYSGYFVGVSYNYSGASTFQIGRIDANNPIPTKAIYLTQVGNVGIGTNNPQATLDVNGHINVSSISTNNIAGLNIESGIRLSDNFGNTAIRPAITPSNVISSFVIHGCGSDISGPNGVLRDDGFLQLSAGGGTDTNTISYIQLSGYSGLPDMNTNIVFGTSGSEKMRITNTGNIGIGTNSPSYTFEVHGNTGFASLNIEGTNREYCNLYLNGYIRQYAPGTNSNILISLPSDPNQPSYFVNGGNYGINTTNPQATLDVNGTTNIRGALSTNIINMTHGELNGISSINGLAASDDIYWTGSGSNIYNSNTGGNVGIGITNPTTKLQVNIGTGNISSGISATLDNITTVIGASKYGPSPFTLDAGSIQTYVNGSPDALLVNPLGGDIFMGSPTSYVDISAISTNCRNVYASGNGSFGSGINVSGYSQINGVIVFNSGATAAITSDNAKTGLNALSNTANVNTIMGAYNNYGSIQVMNTSNTAVSTLILNPLGGSVLTGGSLNVNGNITGIDVTATSDMRLKDRINTLENALSTVIQMRGVSYYPISSSVRKIGVIAQEVEKVLPEVVLTDNSSEGFKSVSYGHITGLLIEAIKELSNKVDKLL
jgi:hypothetical protein